MRFAKVINKWMAGAQGAVSRRPNISTAAWKPPLLEPRGEFSRYDEVKRSKTSAGLLMFRKRNGELEVLLVHPGGPFFRNKDEGAWTIPKGEVDEGEDLLTRAKIEFQEEVGFAPSGDLIPLGSVKQKGGKTVYGWAFEGDLPDHFKPASNTFEIEWPPQSGRRQAIPEVDRAEFFSIEEAKQKINPAQVVFLERLSKALKSPNELT
jgi:predicted NUDIX family NTP pyrophosphohydrolase